MANKKITDLTTAAPVTADILEFVDVSDTTDSAAGSSRKATLNDLPVSSAVTTALAAKGDASTNTSTSVDSEVAVFSGTGGKTIKRATGSGLAKLTSGVLSAATANTDYATPNQDTTGKSAKTDALNSATTVVNVSAATAPTTGQVLTATSSTAATWQTPSSGGGSSTPKFSFQTDFSNASRYDFQNSSGAGTATVGVGGVTLHRTTSNDYAYLRDYLSLQKNHNPYDNNLIFWCSATYSSNSFDWYNFLSFGQISVGAGWSSAKHVGFKIENNFGTPILTGETADGSTTNSITLSPSTTYNGVNATYAVVLTSGVKAEFYVNRELVGTSTTNLPTGNNANNQWQVGVWGAGAGTTQGDITVSNLGYSFDL